VQAPEAYLVHDGTKRLFHEAVAARGIIIGRISSIYDSRDP